MGACSSSRGPIRSALREIGKPTLARINGIAVGGGNELQMACDLAVMVDDAFWQFEMQPSTTLPRLGRAVLKVAYPWVQAEPNVLRIVTSTGVSSV